MGNNCLQLNHVNFPIALEQKCIVFLRYWKDDSTPCPPKFLPLDHYLYFYLIMQEICNALNTENRKLK